MSCEGKKSFNFGMQIKRRHDLKKKWKFICTGTKQEKCMRERLGKKRKTETSYLRNAHLNSVDFLKASGTAFLNKSSYGDVVHLKGRQRKEKEVRPRNIFKSSIHRPLGTKVLSAGMLKKQMLS